MFIFYCVTIKIIPDIYAENEWILDWTMFEIIQESQFIYQLTLHYIWFKVYCNQDYDFDMVLKWGFRYFLWWFSNCLTCYIPVSLLLLICRFSTNVLDYDIFCILAYIFLWRSFHSKSILKFRSLVLVKGETSRGVSIIFSPVLSCSTQNWHHGA